MATDAPAVPSTATPAAAPPAAPIARATSAPNPPTSLADFAALAAADLNRVPDPTPATAAPTESPEAAPAVAPDPPPAPPDPDPTAEAELPAGDQSTWTERERNLHGIVQKQRAEVKAAKAEVTATREENEQLKKLTPTAAAPEPETPPAPPAVVPGPSPGATALTDCNTFDQVDAKALSAATTKARALRLQTTLNRQGREAAVAGLKAAGVTEVDGVPLAEATEESIADFVGNVIEGAELTILSADSRKRFLGAQHTFAQQALKLVPELADAKSQRAQKFEEFVRHNPGVRQLGPHWPVVVAQSVLGMERVTGQPATTTATGAAPPPPATPPSPPTRPAPGAPRVSAAALPKPNRADELSVKMANGTASLAEVEEYGRLAVAV